MVKSMVNISQERKWAFVRRLTSRVDGRRVTAPRPIFGRWWRGSIAVVPGSRQIPASPSLSDKLLEGEMAVAFVA